MRFENKVAVVTGSGGGVGQAYAEALADEGAAVVVVDIVEGFRCPGWARAKTLVAMCLFLLSHQASWIIGQTFNVDGGQVIRS